MARRYARFVAHDKAAFRRVCSIGAEANVRGSRVGGAAGRQSRQGDES